MNSTKAYDLKDQDYYDNFVGLSTESTEDVVEDKKSAVKKTDRPAPRSLRSQGTGDYELKEEEQRNKELEGENVNTALCDTTEPTPEELLDEEDLAELRANDELPFHKNPKVRLIVVIGLGVVGFSFLHIFLTTFTTIDYSFSLIDYENQKEKLFEGEKDPKDKIIEAKNREIERLKTKDIAEAQKAEIKSSNKASEQQQAPKTVKSQPAATPVQRPTSQPAVTPVQRQIHQPTLLAREPVVAKVDKIEHPILPIDPEERWKQAAALGTYDLGNGGIVTASVVETRPPTQSIKQRANRVIEGVAQTHSLPKLIPPGTPPSQIIGVNSRVEAKLRDDFLYAPQSVAQIELKEPLRFNDGSVALPEETILLIEFNPENPPTAIAIPITKILIPVNGQYQEIEAPQDALFVRGKDNKPLKLKRNSGGNNGGFGLDDAIGVTGGILDVPTEVTQTARRVVGGQSSQYQSTSTTLPKGTSIEVYVYQSFVLPGEANSK